MAKLVLGPLLRHVGARDATVWVEVDRPATVEVRAGTATGAQHTFGVAGHHYALVLVTGLQPGSTCGYEVLLDGESCWPVADDGFPPSLIRPIDPVAPVRLAFGSCRYATDATSRPGMDHDVLDVYARRLIASDPATWPEALLLLGDQVYADETSARTKDFIRARRDVSRPPGTEVADFEEYTALYHESWSEPRVRWLLSTVPTSMIFDDHDVRDDWNTSHAWRQDMAGTDWWAERITGALTSYWVYQHLGNLSPADLAADQTYQQVSGLADAEPLLREFARAADAEADGAKGARWSYRRDFGAVRLVVVDSRCGRILAGEQRAMISDDEFAWVAEQLSAPGCEHLLVGTSLPWLLPRALHDLESLDEALAAGSRGRWLAGRAEWLRRALDLEHWAAFRGSFDRLAQLLTRVGRGPHAPATICVLSGDVHHAYVADLPSDGASRIVQITCSPLHNMVPPVMRVAFRVAWSGRLERLTAGLARLARVPPLRVRWARTAGPFFGDDLATLRLDGRRASLLLERAPADGSSELETVLRMSLTGDVGSGRAVGG